MESFNPTLADERKISLEYQVVMHDAYTQLYSLMARPDLYSCNSDEILERCHALEYVLQFLWGFELTDKMHRYDYRIKGCTCPKMDNDDRVGTDQRVVRGGCPIHNGGRYEPEESQAATSMVSDDGTGC